MTRETIEDMISIGMEYLMVAVFLVFVVHFIGIKNDFANVKNYRISTQRNIKEYREFGKYETGYSSIGTADYLSECLYADDVIEAIRNYSDGSIEIYVNRPNASATPIHLTRENARLYPERYSLERLSSTTSGIDSSARFHPYLIYNGSDVRNSIFYNNYSSGTVTGIAFIRY